jgi:predicted CoA-binding protein
MRVLVIGASSDRHKFGNKALRSYVAQGHEVVPVNPNEPEVEGLKTVAKVGEASGDFDRALFYVPPRFGVNVVRQIAERGGVAEVWLNPGADGPEVIAEAEKLGLNVVRACAIVDIGAMPY